MKNKNILKEAVSLLTVTMIFLSTISVMATSFSQQKTMLFDYPILDLQFCQMDFNFDGIMYENTDWGSVDVVYVGQEPIMYFNLAVNGDWQVQNIPVLSNQGVDVDQTMTYYFDLGNDVGTEVTDIFYDYDFTIDILQSMPGGSFNSPVLDDFVELWAGELGGSMPELDEAKPLVGGEANTPKKHAHKNFPNQECGKNECAPAAISNSLKFLNQKHHLGLTEAQTSIGTMKTATGWTANGAPANWWETKKKYMGDNNYPIVTRKITDISKLAAEIDAGQDVEIRETWKDKDNKTCGHVTCLTGITKLKNGDYSLDVVDDRKQGKPGGTDKPRTYIYNSTTGKFYEAGFGHTKFEWAVVECPDLPKWTYHFTFSGGCPGGTLQVFGTHNCVRQDPSLFNGYAKFCDTYQGYIPKTLNGYEINDVIFDFYWDWWCNNEDHIKFASPSWNDETGLWELASMDDWVEENLDEELLIPSIGDASGEVQNIFVIVNLDEYLANPVPPMYEYEIINGECEDLPGYLIGTSPIIFDPYAGPEDNPFFTAPLEFGILVNDGEITFSPVPNQSPFTPEIDGPTSGQTGIEYDYTFVTDDPEDDDVFYYIDWGDGTHENWAGPYASGVDATISHTYDEEGDYVIGAKANDVFDDESDWGYLEVTMPINQHSFHSLFIWFLECFPNAFPIFRHLTGL